MYIFHYKSFFFSFNFLKFHIENIPYLVLKSPKNPLLKHTLKNGRTCK